MKVERLIEILRTRANPLDDVKLFDTDDFGTSLIDLEQVVIEDGWVVFQ